jgi:hypothetical protein
MAKESSTNSLKESLKGCYGSQEHPTVVKQWLIDNIIENTNREKRITLNIMGSAGTSKTSLVKSLSTTPVDYNGKHYDGYEIIDIPIAMCEEMGDILGFPVEEIEMENKNSKIWIKAVDSLISSYIKEGYVNTGRQRTVYAPPSWVPTEEKPGILLFDDANRASPRILKGIMQLVQDYKTISWSLPKGWTMVFTGNPDNRFNQVTAMDTAQLTRMKFITLVPDAIEWSIWAENNNIDKRLISFILRYPEMMVGSERTNPRTLAEFGIALKRFPNLDENNYKKCLIEAYASLDNITVETMMTFFQRSVELVIDPKDILEDFDKNAKDELERLMNKKEPRVDIVNVINDRLYTYIVSDNYKFEKNHVENFQKWLLDENLPKDMSYSLAKRLCSPDCKCEYKRNFLSGNIKLMEIVKMGFGSILEN